MQKWEVKVFSGHLPASPALLIFGGLFPSLLFLSIAEPIRGTLNMPREQFGYIVAGFPIFSMVVLWIVDARTDKDDEP